MAQHDRLIAFLEKEAHFLRERIVHLKERDVPVGVTTGDGDPSPVALSRRDAELKLAEIEEHLRALKKAEAA